MEICIAALKEAIPGITKNDLNTILKEPDMHILDSIVLHGTLENHFGFLIPDEDWDCFTTLAEAIAYCNARLQQQGEVVIEKSRINACRTTEINLPQMANSALSENWLLKEIGDIHWEMLSKGLNQKSSQFVDASGNRLYAAFARINYAISPLNSFKENETLGFGGAIKRYGNHAYFSSVNAHSGNKSLRANLMTSFSARKANDNSTIAPGKLCGANNHIEEMEQCPEFYLAHRTLSKGKVSEIYTGGYVFPVTDQILESMNYTINPYFEINGAGLLYFASYPIIADAVVSRFFRQTMGVKNFDSTYFTIYRDVFYFANCNADDELVLELNSVEHIGGDKIRLSASIYRSSDSKLMARVFTIKQKA